MKLLLSLILVLHTYIVTLQSKGGVRTTTTVEAKSLTEAKKLSKSLYKDQKVISVKLKK